MAFPVPPDARAGRDFQIIAGGDEIVRLSLPVLDPTDSFFEGEWVIPVVSGGVLYVDKVDDGQIDTAPAHGAMCVWTTYEPGDSWNGQGDALATKTVDCLTGSYQAKTTNYEAVGGGAVYTPGFILVVKDQGANNYGILYGVDPAALDAETLAGAVGRVIGIYDGYLHFKVPA